MMYQQWRSELSHICYYYSIRSLLPNFFMDEADYVEGECLSNPYGPIKTFWLLSNMNEQSFSRSYLGLNRSS